MPEPDQLGSWIQDASSWPTPERPTIDALRGRCRERTVRRRATHLASAAVTVLIATAGISVIADQPANRPPQPSATQPEPQPAPGPGADTADSPSGPPEYASPGAPPPVIIDEPTPGEPPPGETEPPPASGSAAHLYEAIITTAPANLSVQEINVGLNSLIFDYRPEQRPEAADQIAPGAALGAPPNYVASVYVEALTPKSYEMYRDERFLRSGGLTTVPGCPDCMVLSIDRSPSYLQYLILTEDAFINIVTEQPPSFADAPTWAKNLAVLLEG